MLKPLLRLQGITYGLALLALIVSHQINQSEDNLQSELAKQLAINMDSIALDSPVGPTLPLSYIDNLFTIFNSSNLYSQIPHLPINFISYNDKVFNPINNQTRFSLNYDINKKENVYDARLVDFQRPGSYIENMESSYFTNPSDYSLDRIIRMSIQYDTFTANTNQCGLRDEVTINFDENGMPSYQVDKWLTVYPENKPAFSVYINLNDTQEDFRNRLIESNSLEQIDLAYSCIEFYRDNFAERTVDYGDLFEVR